MSIWTCMLICALLAVPIGALICWVMRLSDRAIDNEEQREYRKNYLKYLEEKYPELKETDD